MKSATMRTEPGAVRWKRCEVSKYMVSMSKRQHLSDAMVVPRSRFCTFANTSPMASCNSIFTFASRHITESRSGHAHEPNRKASVRNVVSYLADSDDFSVVRGRAPATYATESHTKRAIEIVRVPAAISAGVTARRDRTRVIVRDSNSDGLTSCMSSGTVDRVESRTWNARGACDESCACCALPAAADRLRRMVHSLLDRTHCRFDCRSTDILLLRFGSLNRPRIEHALEEVTDDGGYVDVIFHEDEPAEECGETREDEQIETTHGSDATTAIRSRVTGYVASLHMRVRTNT
jgi:hypothetical protein